MSCKRGADAGVGIGIGWVGGKVGAIPLTESKMSEMSNSCFLKDIDPMFELFKNS